MEGRQFRILYRDFLFRMVDVELLSVHGEMQNLLVQFAALLAAFNFVVVLVCFPRYVRAALPHEALMMAAWNDEEFLISTTMAITAIFAILAWHAILPDRRDCLVLGVLPVRLRTIFLAKTAAIASALGISIAAINIFTGVCYPLLIGGAALGALRALIAYWITMAASGLFIFCGLLAAQGVALQILSYPLFLRFSSFLQLTAFFAILGVYFLKPPLAATLPAYWFLGLFHEINGSANPAFGLLAARSLWCLLAAFSVAAVTYGLAYARTIRRIIEQPDIAPATRRGPLQAAAQFLSKPVDRAIVLFTARTIARSRQHRLLLAAYGGIGLAIALVYARSMLYGYPEQRWDQPNHPFLIASLVSLFFLVTGMRAVFALPVSLPSNWIFRITAVHSPAAYFAAVRKALLALTAVPVWIAAAISYFVIWPGRAALAHMAVLVVIGVLLVHRSLYQFRKIPFACSYLPGKANLNVKLGWYGMLFLFLSDHGVQLELWTMQRPGRFAVFFGVLAGATAWVRHRTLELAASPHNSLQFEELPSEVNVLDLRRDGVSSAR